MTDEVVVAALVLFHRHNTFLYFRDVLPNHVFVNPQIPLDIVNSIISFSYKLNADEFRGIPIKFCGQIKKGIITEEMLCSKAFCHFFKGIYEARDAINLFCHTLTLAPLNPNAPNSKTNQYLMMCLKPAIPDKELKNIIPQLPANL